MTAPLVIDAQVIDRLDRLTPAVAAFIKNQRRPRFFELAACRSYNGASGGSHKTDWPIAESSSVRASAKKLANEFCATCPVSVQCLLYAKQTGSVGLWGGAWCKTPVSHVMLINRPKA